MRQVKKALIGGGVAAAAVVVLALVFGGRAVEPDTTPTLSISAGPARSTLPAGEPHRGFLYGRVTTVDGTPYEGRLRFGLDQEAFWGDPFNGAKHENPWLGRIPAQQLPKERRSFEIFGFKLGAREGELEADRPLMVRFGDIERIEAHGDQVRVTLKGGTAFDVGRFNSSDFDDGLRVWDAARGVVDLADSRLRTIELLATPALGDDVPSRLHGTVRTRQGEFTGFLGWNRHEYVGSDELDGRTGDDGELAVRFDAVRSIERRSGSSSKVTLRDGREIVLYGTSDVDADNRGVYVEDERYGRVLVSWGAFERVDFDSSDDSGPAYDDFPPGRSLAGSVTTLDGRRLTGRLVYDLDESETVETLDAPRLGVDYTIPFGLIASIVPAGDELVRVVLHNGEELQLERSGDLGQHNGGMLIFVDGHEQPGYVPWADVERIDLDR
jgi:hypothetical protein